MRFPVKTVRAEGPATPRPRGRASLRPTVRLASVAELVELADLGVRRVAAELGCQTAALDGWLFADDRHSAIGRQPAIARLHERNTLLGSYRSSRASRGSRSKADAAPSLAAFPRDPLAILTHRHERNRFSVTTRP